MNQTLIRADGFLLLLLDPECQYGENLPVKTVDLSNGQYRVCVYGSHRWTSWEKDFPTEGQAFDAYCQLIKEPLLTRGVLRRHGLKQS